jgi:hypothetical protein
MLGDHKPGRPDARLADLGNGDIPAIRAAARAFPLTGRKASEPRTAPGHFEHNAHRMRYARLKSPGMLTSSGAAEAACKSIAGQRLKPSGMRGTGHGAAGILTLRCPEASNRRDEIPASPGQAPAA